MRYNSNLHMFPEQCVKHLKEKFHLGELNIRELMYVMKRIGIKTFKVHANGGVYDVFLRRDINGVQDFEFINTLVQYRKEKRIKDEWSKEPITDYTPEMSNMKNASDDLLKNDDIYFENENRKFMKQDNKKLYESIMASVAREVKKALHEGENNVNDNFIESHYQQWLVNNEDFLKKYLSEHLTIELNHPERDKGYINRYMTTDYSSVDVFLKLDGNIISQDNIDIECE